MNIPNAFLQHIVILLFLPAVLLVAAGLGRLVLCKTNLLFFSRAENFLFASGIGFALLSYAAFALGGSQNIYPSSVHALLLIAAVASFAGWFVPQNFSQDSRGIKRSLSSLDKWLILPLGLLLCAGLIHVLTPAIGNDSLTYHLAVPNLYINNHGFYYVPGNIFSNYPLHTEMLFLLGLVLHGEVLAKIIHFSMALLVLISMRQFIEHHLHGKASPLLCALIFFSIPSVFRNAHMAYHDMAMAFYSFLALFSFMNWFEKRENGWLILCGVFSGLTAATKYSGLLLPLLGFLGILFGARKKKEKAGRAVVDLVLYFTGAVIAGIPFYIKTGLLTGNPLYPFFYDFFGGFGWSSEQARFYSYFLHTLGMGRSLFDYILLPWNLSINAQMHSPLFDGVVGPVFILTLPFAFGLKKTPDALKIASVYCLFFFLFWASSAQQIRYLIPIFPILAVLTAYIAHWYYQEHKLRFAFLILLIAGSLLHNVHHISKEFKAIRPDRFVVGHESRKAYLTRLLPSYSIFRHINTHLPENTKIFFIYMRNLGYLCHRPHYSDSMFESYSIEKILDHARTPEEVLGALKKMKFTHILYDIHYTEGTLSTFSPKAKSLFIAFQNKYLKLIKKDKERFYLYEISAG